MSKRDKTITAVIAKDIAGWLARRKIRNAAIFSYNPNGKNFYILNGKKIPEQEFDAANPVEHFPPTASHDNYDQTKNYMFNKKCFR